MRTRNQPTDQVSASPQGQILDSGIHLGGSEGLMLWEVGVDRSLFGRKGVRGSLVLFRTNPVGVQPLQSHGPTLREAQALL